ncbi:MAG TPA: hypothetical protein VNQ77_05670 [Frankiaceae bacterium]|nr:hypothetical protein [Frankiaceae bacterium]
MDETTPAPRRGRTVALIGAGLVGGFVLAGFATASAQTPAPSTPGDDTEQSAPLAPGGKRGHHGPRGHGMGIHGEFVTAAPDGGYQTIATQQGEVTAVSATSITVRSEDGFSRTYAVDDNTLVNAGNEGIADVEDGDDVHVKALVVDGKASAVSVNDGTQVRRLRERWAPRPPAPEAEATASSAT